MRHGELGVMGLPEIVLPACGIYWQMWIAPALATRPLPASTSWQDHAPASLLLDQFDAAVLGLAVLVVVGTDGREWAASAGVNMPREGNKTELGDGASQRTRRVHK